MGYHESKMLFNVLCGIGGFLFILAIVLKRLPVVPVVLFVLGVICLAAGTVIHSHFGKCPFCHRYISPSGEIHHCPHCGERLI